MWRPYEDCEDGKKAKAGIKLLGFADPDLTEITYSPTMTRTTRQLIMAIAAMLGMTMEKAKVTATFLQGAAAERDFFAVPVEELVKTLGIEPVQAARLITEAHGLVAAPLSRFRKVCAVMLSLGFLRIRSDPYGWMLLTGESVRSSLGGTAEMSMITLSVLIPRLRRSTRRRRGRRSGGM